MFKKSEYKGHTGYYVAIISKNRGRYDKPFVPSDNLSGDNRILREDIRVIDGNSFYELWTGKPSALRDLYQVLLKIIAEIMGVKDNTSSDPLFWNMYSRSF